MRFWIALGVFMFCVAVNVMYATGVDSTRIELLHVGPEPFREELKFTFKIHDGKDHVVKVIIHDANQHKVLMQEVHVYPGHETVTISTIDFWAKGMYSVKVKVDGKLYMLRKFRHE
ncbi:MAG: DUF3244 domain-containing protein [Chitinophagales bacterium]|nr:DUF3244 domain-containing protein [Chitinophagales bacterium]MDW8420066.1 hypothetical protein [Chitinophagales bacterium]